MDENTDIDELLNQHFQGKVVRKDLTKLLKEGANVPIYVLEYLLGMYCASNDEQVIKDGLENVKRILAENYVRPDEAEKVKSKIHERGSYKVIDKVTVKLNEKRDVYEAMLSNLGVKGVEVSSSTVRQYEKLLVGGIWFVFEGQRPHKCKCCNGVHWESQSECRYLGEDRSSACTISRSHDRCCVF
jgi:ATP-dependent Lon protease